ncbi:hypothetical protein PG991_013396 [Apiospora marii]|uniref:Myb-like domain-containing protein n=1 Tax=Apiospora marii TaxID=335849 RepID=A0ABR1R602_9PEZI
MAETKTPQFTQRDMEISAKAWACLTGDAKAYFNTQIDFDKLATLGGYKNSASARECWRTTKIRLMAAAGVDKDGKSKGQQDQPETPAGKTGKAGKAAASSKRKRTTTKKVAPAPAPTAAADSNDDYEDEDAASGSPTPAPPKKARRGAAATTPGGGRSKKTVKTEEIAMEPIFDEEEEQRMQQLKLSDPNGAGFEDDAVGVDAMIKAEEQRDGMTFDEI